MKKEEENKIGKIVTLPITQEVENSYLSYAMSVIVSRALPDVRDGLKPVQRRILYSMWTLGLKHSAKFRKSATVVGEVLGKFHPHGDAAVYETMVRMAQDFSLRYPLVDGQGNFGSMDGDSAAAMRYTEARLAAIAEEMLFDIEKETVDWTDNYDGTRKEPKFLPAKLPQLLLNGTMGIAVGMATNIPPHNLAEVVDAVCYLIDNPNSSIEELVKNCIKGPDFPTGGIIYNQKDIIEAYSTGRGKIITRAKADIVESKKGKFEIVVSEITYQTNKATLIQKIAQLVKDGKIQGIKDIRDESDKDGVRIVIELKKDAFPKKILNKLYSATELQKAFHFNMLALVDGIEPRVLNLKSIIEYYIAHRQKVVTRRTQFELKKAKERAHILEGLKKALDHINQVIETIKKSADREKAHHNLILKFGFSEKQATAILEMKLQTLAGLERKKIEDELEEKLKLIAKLEAILRDPKKILKIIKKELLELKEKYQDKRRTKVLKGAVGDFSQEDLIPNEEAIIIMSEDGYIKRLSPTAIRTQKRGGRGVIGSLIKEGDQIDKVVSAMTHDNLLFFTDTGKVFQIKAHEIPESSRASKGTAVVNFLQIAPNEKITSLVAIPKDSSAKYLVMQTRRGKIKKTPLADFETVRRNGLIAIKLEKNDSLEWAGITSGKDEIIVITQEGQSIRFKESNIRPMGRGASGVRAIRLKGEDQVAGMGIIKAQSKDAQLLVVTEKGFGKRTSLSRYKTQSRGGSGIKAAKITTKTGKLVSCHVLEQLENFDLVVSSNKGQLIRTPLKNISILGRATQGVKIMRLKSGEIIAATAILE